LQGFSISVAGKVLLENADLKIAAGRRYGFVGPNGQGKSTLLMHIAHKKLAVPRNLDILLVEQEVEGSNTTPLEIVLAAGALPPKPQTPNPKPQTPYTLEIILAAAPQSLTPSTLKPQPSTLNHNSSIRNQVYRRLSARGSDAAKAEATRILLGLGFPLGWQSRPSKSFSGGWRMRISLARALFMQPSLLLLDEPTNHLDLNAVLWLDDYLNSWKKTLVVVSHDVGFLNKVSTDIIHLRDRQLDAYRGNYDSFVSMASSQAEQRQKAWEKQEKALRALKLGGKPPPPAPPQFSGASKNYQRGKGKGKGGGGGEEPTGPTQLLKRPREYEVSFSFPDPPELPPPILQINSASFKYENGPRVFSDLNLGVWADSRIAIVGANGCGKSTLLNLLTGDLEATDGEVRINHRLRIGRYNQHTHETIPMDKTPVEYLQRHGNPAFGASQRCRAQLGRYGLESHAHNIFCDKLSGGQKARVVFAGMGISTPHILILDEPTNHLDIESIQALADAITKYRGGVVLVSHDSRLIQTAIESHEQALSPPPPPPPLPYSGIRKRFRPRKSG
ncbi:P-loop containing nucleoside triphosphate hydrolase protein, partial [Baffinella frigidus]